jgi:fatty-acyl-CoA synthase
MTEDRSRLAPAGSRREPVQATTLGDLVWRAAALRPDSAAAVFPGDRASAAELCDRSLRTARSLRGLGVGPGDSVGVLMPNCPDFVSTLLGASLLGATVVTMNVRYRVRELSYVVHHSRMKALVTTGLVAEHVDFAERLREAFPGLTDTEGEALALDSAPDLQTCILLGAGAAEPGFIGAERFAEFGDRVEQAEIEWLADRIRLRDPAILMYTSGTTASPKGCVLSHEALVRTAIAQVERFEMGSDDVFWSPLPLFHIASILALMNSLWSGATFVSSSHFEAGAAIAQIEEEGATILYATFPTIVQAMIDHPNFGDLDLDRIRLYSHIGPPGLQRQVQAAFGNAKQFQSYGATEISGVVSVHGTADTDEERATTCGKPWPGTEVRIADPETGLEVPTGEEGEILVRGFGLFTEYFDDPERTAEAIDPEGWFHSGDIGSMGADGRVRFHGRYKDMLKVGGENVAAAEVEDFLCAHPSIQMAQVVGVPDDRLVEVVAAFVQVVDGRSISTQEVIDHCDGSIASFKVPRHVRFVSEWPMSATKIQKFALREQLVGELDAESASPERLTAEVNR